MSNIQQDRYLKTKNAVALYFVEQQQVSTLADAFLRQDETQDVSYLTQLASSFPAIAYLLLTDQLPDEKMAPTLEMVQSGAPMKEIAAFVGLPMWLRKLEADAFAFPEFPFFLGRLPENANFVRAINNQIPASNSSPSPYAKLDKDTENLATKHDHNTNENNQQQWLKCIASLSVMNNDKLTLWMASQSIDDIRKTPLDELVLLLCWLWYHVSPNQSDTLPITTPQRLSHLSFAKALECSAQWHNQNITQHSVMKEDFIASQANSLKKLRRQEISGYIVKLLESQKDFTHEGHMMNNCMADQYKEHGSLFFSILQGNVRVANTQISINDNDDFVIRQLKGFKNSTIPAKIKTEIQNVVEQLHQKFAFDKIVKARSFLLEPSSHALLKELYHDFIEAFPALTINTLIKPFTTASTEQSYGFCALLELDFYLTGASINCFELGVGLTDNIFSIGEGGNDRLWGNPEDDTFHMDGDDVISGDLVDDTLHIACGNDMLEGFNEIDLAAKAKTFTCQK